MTYEEQRYCPDVVCDKYGTLFTNRDFCDDCGKKLKKAEFCKYCKKVVISPKQNFCPTCGRPIR